MSKITCPNCGEALKPVTQGANSMLNSDQFDAVKLGDWFCVSCPENGAKYRYFWSSQLVAPITNHSADIQKGDVS